MNDLGARIRRLRPAVVFTPGAGQSCRLEDHSDGLGSRITFWDTTALGPQPTEAELLAADPTPTVEEKLDRLDLPARVYRAIALRLSASWTTAPPTGATAAEKARAMAIIDAAGQRVLDEIRR